MTLEGQGNENIQGISGDLLVVFEEKSINTLLGMEKIYIEVRINYPRQY